MFRKIMVPVDLEHQDALEKGLKSAADIARLYDSQIVFVGVTAETPTSIAHTPSEYAEKLSAFASEHGGTAKAYTAHDPAIDLDKTLIDAAKETGADLIVVASHVPTFADFIQHAHGAHLADHAPVSVLVIR